MSKENVIKIDVEQVLRERLPRLSKLIPQKAIEWLKRTICQDELNNLLEENKGLEGADFCRGVLNSLNVRINLHNENHLPPRDHRRVIIVSNHPLGGLDGLALIDIFQRYYGGQVWFVVNDLLMAVKPLESVFIPVNKFGKQSKSSMTKLDQVLEGNDPVIVFPAGMVSRYQSVPFQSRGRKKMVCDLDWKKTFVKKARVFKRDILPLFFEGENSMHFYKMANLRKNLGLKFNIEMIYLPSEIFKAKDKEFNVYFGNLIPWEKVEAGPSAKGFARSIGSLVYSYPSQAAEQKGASRETASFLSSDVHSGKN